MIGIAYWMNDETFCVPCNYSDALEGFGVSHRVETTESGLFLETESVSDSANSLIRVSNRLINSSSSKLTVKNPKLKLRVSGNCFSLDVKTSSWCREAQEERLQICDEMVIGSKGRSCSEYVPHFIIHSDACSYVIDLLPAGDWRARFVQKREHHRLDVELDCNEDEVVFELAPGQSFEVTPTCLISHMNLDENIAPWRVQSFALDHLCRHRHDVLPVVYNTWFDRFHKICWESLENQLLAAKNVGCEVFMLDAGWYGSKSDDWCMVGDWRENSYVFSSRSLLEFANIVRANGLEFGLWIEPERVHADAPIRNSHPEWFIKSDTADVYYPDLCKSEVFDWVLAEIVRVVETYGVKWLKVDCNHDFCSDPHKLGHRNRMEAWYRILDEVCQKFPDLVIEGCASGGLRNDLLTVSHFDTHFLSDTVDPIDTIRIGMSTLSWLSPRMTSKWAVVYPTGNGWTPYGNDGLETADLVLCPQDATSSRVSSYHLDFAVRSAMTGVLGLSGNIAGLSGELQSELAQHVAFYKKHRAFILSSAGIPLTPVESIDKRDGLAAIQLSDRAFQRHMIFVYNISEPTGRHSVRPVNLKSDDLYNVADENGFCLAENVEGRDLLDGWDMECRTGQSRVIFIENTSCIARKNSAQ